MTPSLKQPFTKPISAFLEMLGQMTLYLGQSLRFLMKGKWGWHKILAETAAIGTDSIPMVALICGIAGSVLALQTSKQFAQTGADAYVGGLVALAMIREMGPIFTCLAVGARAGTAIASEIANMKVTEQVAALQMLHVHPVRYLVAPRLVAAVISLPLLTILGEVIGILGGMGVAWQTAHLHYHKYLDSIWLYVKPSDIRVSLIKAVVFGVILALVSCTVGLTTTGGAREVGRSTTRAAVWTAILMILADFCLTWIFFGTSFEGGQ